MPLTRRDLLRATPLAMYEAPPGTVPAPPAPATFNESPAFRRVTLEMSLKPFRKIDDASVRATCTHIFRQWDALLRRVDAVAIMLWTADGSEILDYRGRLDDELEWARYIGIGTPPKSAASGGPNRIKRLHEQPRFYMPNPPRITYADLRRIIRSIKTVGHEVSAKTVTVGATFDPGPEFANSRFKYAKHPEISPGGTMGAATWVTCISKLNADKDAYAGFPKGIPQDTSLGAFLGRQSKHFLTDMGFDYLWLSNGFGFSASAWNVTGPLFDGKKFDATAAPAMRDNIIAFWRDFRRECPRFPLETRGTNLLPGADLATAATPLRDIYRGNFNMVAPPNSPWAALDGDFGLELVGYMARISELPPGDLFPFRYYTHDPWWLNSPWFDRYGREPHDIYLPLATARIDARGNVTRPGNLEFLTIDDSYGRTPDQCPNEVIPHLLSAIDHFSDEPGLATWVYPFDEYHDLVLGPTPNPALPFFGDWFIRSAVNEGFPLNTVVSTRNFAASLQANPGMYRKSVLLSPVPVAGSAIEKSLLAEWRAGQDILFYGPVSKASAEMRDALGLTLTTPIEGLLDFESTLPHDQFRRGAAASRINHRALTSAGGVDTLGDPCVTVKQGAEHRTYAVFREARNGAGRIGWLRGTLTANITNAKLPVTDDPTKLFPAAALLRAMLAKYGTSLEFRRTSPTAKTPLVLGARTKNGFYISGYAPSTTTTIEMRFAWGAPILSGMETWLENGRSSYTMPRSWHRELRCFVDQAEPGEISCVEVHSGHPGIRRRLQLSGLRNATVHFLPEPGLKPILALNDPRPQNEKSMPYEIHDNGTRITAPNLTGTLLISW